MVKLSFSDMAAATESDAHFIDIDVPSSEFEFQMPSSSSCVSVENDSTTSPADELFFKGKLLPLHLPPRLQMLQTLLNINTLEVEETTTYEDGSNPAESSSPSESCRVSCELNPPSEFFFQWSTSSSNEFGSFVHNNPKKSWSKKLKLMKQSSVLLTQKLKNSRAYLINLKALFLKSASSNGENREAAAIEKQECGKSNRIITKKIPFGAFSNVEETKSNDNNNNNNIIQRPRRSFSGAIKRHSPSKCLSSSSSNSSCSGASSLSSSFSVNSNALFNLHFFNKSSGEIETSVEDAIAHCKNCQ